MKHIKEDLKKSQLERY